MKKYLLLVVLILMFTGIWSAKSAGTYLVLDETAKASDVIVVLSGDRGERTERGAGLFQHGYAPYLMMSGGPVYETTTMAQLMKAHAMKLGVPEQAILTEDESDSTYENAIYSKEIMLKKGFRSAIVVSSNYHMKRVKLIFDREFKSSGIKITYVASEDRYFDPKQWWSSNKSIMITLNEYLKLLGYSLGKNT